MHWKHLHLYNFYSAIFCNNCRGKCMVLIFTIPAPCIETFERKMSCLILILLFIEELNPYLSPYLLGTLKSTHSNCSGWFFFFIWNFAFVTKISALCFWNNLWSTCTKPIHKYKYIFLQVHKKHYIHKI